MQFSLVILKSINMQETAISQMREIYVVSFDKTENCPISLRWLWNYVACIIERGYVQHPRQVTSHLTKKCCWNIFSFQLSYSDSPLTLLWTGTGALLPLPPSQPAGNKQNHWEGIWLRMGEISGVSQSPVNIDIFPALSSVVIVTHNTHNTPLYNLYKQ